LAKQARQMQNSGQLVRAYMLYAEASAREPGNPTYRANRDALAPAASLLGKAEVQTLDNRQDLPPAGVSTDPPVELASRREWEREGNFAQLPQVVVPRDRATFELRGNEKDIFTQVAGRFNLSVIFDHDFVPQPSIRLSITDADFRAVMEALTAITGTFVFPTSSNTIFVARDTEAKRNELEPNVLLTFPLPNALDQKDLIEAANAVRSVLSVRTIGWDSVNRMVMIRDRAGRARTARAMLDALLLPKAQVSFEVEILTFDTDRTYHYGWSGPTSAQVVDFGNLGGLKSLLPTIANATKFLAFGGGASLIGVSVTDSTFFAQYSNSISKALFDSTVVVSNGQTANFHVGNKYPIPQALFTGFQQSNAQSSLYNPIGQVTLEDLGLLLKLTPRVGSDSTIGVEIEAAVKSLGSQSINTVPIVLQREYKGSVNIREGEWAIVAGLNSMSNSVTRSGLAGLSSIPGLNQVLSENTRNNQTSDTLIVIKPFVTRLPMSARISPQYLLGPTRGQRVLL
jgi:general secretion pathway protein D